MDQIFYTVRIAQWILAAVAAGLVIWAEESW
jgi:hypothetical protein